MTVHYRIAVENANAHRFSVTLTLAHPRKNQRVSLPVWIPGSYLVREFSQHLQGLRAEQNGQAVALQQLNKNTWQANNSTQAPLVLHYQVYAFDRSVRTAFLDSDRGFFNPTSLCLRAHGHEDAPHALELQANSHTTGWAVATGLTPTAVNRQGFGTYAASDYDELADSPFEMGRFWSGSFSVRGVPHRLVVSGAGPWLDGQRLLRDTQRIVQTQMAFWHGNAQQPSSPPPFERYVFMLHVTGDGYGGLEHRNSTALIARRADLPRLDGQPAAALKASDGYTTLLGLISHEYFHTWNVKRMRPGEFKRYDYERENHTALLWFFEGFTSYYDDLMLRRAGLLSPEQYLMLLAKTFNQVQQTPGRHVQSVAEASFDAWTKYYRINENTPNVTVSYYTKGALLALCLDLGLRVQGRTTLDDVMRALWARTQGGPMTEADVHAVLKQRAGPEVAASLAEWVHGTGDLPVAPALRAVGLNVSQEPAALAQRLGLRVSEDKNGITIKNVFNHSAAEASGLAAGDEWLGVEVGAGERAQAWRLHRLADITLYLGTQRRLTAIIARDQRLLRLPLQWPDDWKNWRISLPTDVQAQPPSNTLWKHWLL